MKRTTNLLILAALLFLGAGAGAAWQTPLPASFPDGPWGYGGSVYRTETGRVVAVWLENLAGSNTCVPHFGEMVFSTQGDALTWTSATADHPLIPDGSVTGLSPNGESRTSCVAWEEPGPCRAEPGWLRVLVAWTRYADDTPEYRAEIWLTSALLDDQGTLVQHSSTLISAAYSPDKPWIDARDPSLSLDDASPGGARRCLLAWREVQEAGGRYEPCTAIMSSIWDQAPKVLPYPSGDYLNCTDMACAFVDSVPWVGAVFEKESSGDFARVPYSAALEGDIQPDDWLQISDAENILCTELVLAGRAEPGAPETLCALYLTWLEEGAGPPTQRGPASWFALRTEGGWENVLVEAERPLDPYKGAALATLGKETLVCWSRKGSQGIDEVVAAYSAEDPLADWIPLGQAPFSPEGFSDAISWGATFDLVGRPAVLWSQKRLAGPLPTMEQWSCSYGL